MTIRVESVWDGRNVKFGITLPSGGREYVRGDCWNRSTAKEALDLLERVYGYKRSNIRFRIR